MSNNDYQTPTIVALGHASSLVKQNRASPVADGGYDSNDKVLLTQNAS